VRRQQRHIADGMKYVMSGSQQDEVQFEHDLQVLQKLACAGYKGGGP